jgi:Tfp pilus assembly protein PilE
MERGAQALVKMMLASLVLGLLVLLIHPDYRAALAALRRHQPELSPVWQTNERYYTEITVTAEPPDVQPK